MPQGVPESVPDDGLTTRQRRNRALLVVHTGEMKGKSTAAFGLALRAWNQGWPIGVFQFVKSAKWKVGEENALTVLGASGEGGSVVWHKMGEGWSWTRKQGTDDDHATNARGQQLCFHRLRARFIFQQRKTRGCVQHNGVSHDGVPPSGLPATLRSSDFPRTFRARNGSGRYWLQIYRRSRNIPRAEWIGSSTAAGSRRDFSHC